MLIGGARTVKTDRFFTGNEFSRLDEARAIVDKNIMVGDSLKAMQEWAQPQLSLF